MYVLTLMDWYSATFPPLIVAVLETVLVCHVYGKLGREKIKEG